MENVMEKIVSLAKRRGFFYPGSDLYGGLANTYDYGPMGTELLRNIKNLWWKTFVHGEDDMVGLDGSIISHHRIWEASGHATGFADAMIDCKNCKLRMRADHLIEDYWEVLRKSSKNALTEALQLLYRAAMPRNMLEKLNTTGKVEGLSIQIMSNIIEKLSYITCPNCGKHDWTDVRKFNLLFPVQLGIIEGEKGLGYLRGETAQVIFVNFKNVTASTRVKLPFGIAQIGKSFRNEITPGNAIFRTVEFEQAEIEYFFDPNAMDWKELFEDWKKRMYEFVTDKLGIQKEKLQWRSHTDEERSFYSTRTEDLEYIFPFGTKELWGLAYRSDYDLTQHGKFSGKDMTITDPQTGEKITPHVIEPAGGINRFMLMILCDAYQETEQRVFLKIKPSLAPVKAAVFPLLGNKPELIETARAIYKDLKKSIDGIVGWDDRGNIGKRYLSQDEVGTPFCITVDFQTLEDKTVTVRHRDTAEQERIAIDTLASYLNKKL